MGPFEMKLRQFAEKAKGRADAAVRQVVLDVWGRVIVRSPVDTGRFRANWQYSTGQMPTRIIEVEGTTEKPAPAPTPAGVVQGAGVVHYLGNNLPYARRLEYGHSDQAPQGMVRLTIAEFKGIVDDAARAVAQ